MSHDACEVVATIYKNAQWMHSIISSITRLPEYDNLPISRLLAVKCAKSMRLSLERKDMRGSVLLTMHGTDL